MPRVLVLDENNKVQAVDMDVGQIAYLLERGVDVYGDDTDPAFDAVNRRVIEGQRAFRQGRGEQPSYPQERGIEIEAIAAEAANKR